MSATPIPKTAPFVDEEIELLNRVVGPASPTQRAWLAGFLAGVEAATAPSQPAAPPLAAEPLTIVFASEFGQFRASGSRHRESRAQEWPQAHEWSTWPISIRLRSPIRNGSW